MYDAVRNSVLAVLCEVLTITINSLDDHPDGYLEIVAVEDLEGGQVIFCQKNLQIAIMKLIDAGEWWVNKAMQDAAHALGISEPILWPKSHANNLFNLQIIDAAVYQIINSRGSCLGPNCGTYTHVKQILSHFRCDE
jgi:hypothetical protein